MMKFGIFELVEGDAQLVDQSYLLTLDFDRPVSEKHSIGFSAYFLPDRGGYSYPSSVFAPYRSAWDVWLGGRFRLALARRADQRLCHLQHGRSRRLRQRADLPTRRRGA